jgi:hypothetical protein
MPATFSLSFRCSFGIGCGPAGLLIADRRAADATCGITVVTSRLHLKPFNERFRLLPRVILQDYIDGRNNSA